MKISKLTTLLGIALDGGRLSVAVLRRAGGRIETVRTLQSPLTLDPLTGDPELVGREIRNRLDEAGINQRHCVVCVPLKWALVLRTDLPDLPEPDLQSYLTLQAEREFPFAPEDLLQSTSRYMSPSGAKQATLVAIPINYIAALQKAFKAAHLRPVSFTLGIASLMNPGEPSGAGEVTLLAGDHGLDLALGVGGGIIALRTLDDVMIEEGPEGIAFDGEMVARQLRITLGQLPQDIRGALRVLRIFGPAGRIAPLMAELKECVGPMGMRVEAGGRGAGMPEAASAGQDDTAATAPALIAAASRLLRGQGVPLEFLPPRPSLFSAYRGRFSSRWVLVLAGAAAVLILGAGGAFFLQSMKLSGLETQWKAIAAQVKRVQTLQSQVRRYRDWFDESPQSLLIAQRLTEAFPEEGTVWATALHIKDLSEVSLTGKATNNREWLRMRDRLQGTKGIEEVKVLQMREDPGGKDPMQFTLSFRWTGEKTDGF